jgi:hypothetical protein
MKKPTVDELKDYARELGYNDFDAEQFFDYYEACGWTVGRGKPMRSWKAAVRNWRRMAAAYASARFAKVTRPAGKPGYFELKTRLDATHKRMTELVDRYGFNSGDARERHPEQWEEFQRLKQVKKQLLQALATMPEEGK